VQAARVEFSGAAFTARRGAEPPVPGQRFLRVVTSPAAFPLPPQQPPHGVIQQRLVELAARCHRMLDAIGEQATREIRIF
jgi:hypothetical protein